MFERFYITNQGKALLSKAQAGGSLRFTRMRMGRGILSGQSPEGMSALLDPVADFPLHKVTAAGAVTAVSAQITNAGFLEPVVFREIGLHADDPDQGEVLFAYGYAGEHPDYIPAASTSQVDYLFAMNLEIGNAAEVSLSATPGGLFFTRADLVPIENGGTGASSAGLARAALGAAPVSHSSSGTGYGMASASVYGHAKASTALPLASGAAALGADNGQYARGNHVHPMPSARDVGAWPADTPLGKGVNLNAVQAAGVYYCATAEDAHTMVNAPTSGAFALEVLNGGGVAQIVTCAGVGGAVVRHMRNLFGGVWTRWARILTDENVQAGQVSFEYPTIFANSGWESGEIAFARAFTGLGRVFVMVNCAGNDWNRSSILVSASGATGTGFKVYMKNVTAGAFTGGTYVLDYVATQLA